MDYWIDGVSRASQREQECRNAGMLECWIPPLKGD